jgi:Ser/Thr protein kinase RdoA (MazF antagonist)
MTEEWIQLVLVEVADKYGLQLDNLRKLSGGFENLMYGHDDKKHRVVVRITPPGHKTIKEVEAEMDWLAYLFQHGAPVQKMIPSLEGKSVEVINTNQGNLPVVCFQWASGSVVHKDDFSPELIRIWGRAVGMMHRLTKDYSPSSPGRIQWYEDEYLSKDLIPADQTLVHERFDTLMNRFKDLPQTRDTFGLIHQDIHHANLFLDEDRITVLDFDDAVYGFFIFDIANALGFSIWEKPETMSNIEFADYYLKHFMEGYSTENHLDDYQLEQLPYALKLFEFIHYNAFNMDFNLAGSGSIDSLDGKIVDILVRYRQRIEQDLPYIEHTFNPYEGL